MGTLTTPKELKENALAFLKKNTTMVLGTSNKDYVWSATVHFVVTDDFELLFMSRPDTKHSLNIVNNPNVSVVVTRDKKGYEKSIQLAGEARCADGVEWNTHFPIYEKFVKNAASRKDSMIYVVTPTEVWMIDEKLLGTRARTKVI